MTLNWKDYCKGFAIQKSHINWEAKALCVVSSLNNIPYKLVNNIKQIPPGWIPSGTVKWVSKVLGVEVKPDYFPSFLKDWVKRKIWYEEKWPLKRLFIKPATQYKKFTGFITTGTYSKKRKGPFVCSEIVKFVDEWRYYVVYGKLLGAYWYIGIDDNPVDAPNLDINWPEDWCGTADFGRLDNGNIELIECHHPFACGWYGKKHELYAEFLTLGWKYLKEKYNPVVSNV